MHVIGAAAEVQDTPAARSLGARGSRTPIGHDDPTVDPGLNARAVLAAVPQWWEEIAHAAGLKGCWLQVDEAIEGLEPAPVVPQPADLGNATGSDIGTRYADALPTGLRSRHGRHYTPMELAQHLWTMARLALGQRRSNLPLPGLVSDPACGGGALLLPPLRQHLLAKADSDPRAVLAGLPSFLRGVDADPCAVWIANVVLAAELLPVLARIPATRRRPLPKLAYVGDGLANAPSARVVVMNPPYGRVRLDKDERTRWESYLYGHANLYSLFLGAGLESLDEEGVLAAIIPTSFLAGRYFSSLRAELARQAPLREMTFVEERGGVFAGVLQETCLAAFTRRRVRRTTVSSANGSVVPVARVASPRGDAPWVLPRRDGDAEIAAAARAMPLTLKLAGWKVSTGPLVWNRRKSDLSSEQEKGRHRVLWAVDLDGGKLHRDPQRDDVRWLSSQKDTSSVLLEEPAVLVQRTTAPEQQRRLVCVELTPKLLKEWGGAIAVENHVNVIRPASSGSPLMSRSTLTAILSTRTVDRLMRCISGSVAVSAYELESLPLPDAATLRSWEPLRGEALEVAVSTAYVPMS